MLKVFTTIAVLLLGLAAWLTFGVSARYLASGEKTVGYVVEVIDDGSSYTPLIQYNTTSGETRYYHGLGSGSPAYRLGESVAVRYLPDQPWNAVISSSFHEMWLAPVLAGGIGALFCGFALLVRRAERRKPPASATPKPAPQASRNNQRRGKVNAPRTGKKKQGAARRG